MRAALDGPFAYIKAFLDDPGVASVAPSSRFLVERVVKAMDLPRARAIIEYGAASGVITRRILEAMPRDARLLAVELNKRLFEGLRSGLTDARAVLRRGDARDIDAIAGEAGIGQADVVVSGIPFTFLSERGRREVLRKTLDLLKPGGRFVAYQVTTRLLPALKDRFRRVDVKFELRNLPPLFVFTAFK